MLIARAEVIPYWLPFRRDYVTARGRLVRREMVLLRLVDEEGREAWGEGVPLSLRGGADLERVVGELESWARAAHERPIEVPLSPADPRLRSMAAPGRCAVLTALADLEAQRREVPLWRLLGAANHEPVPCNATLISGSPAAVAADAERWAEDGFTTFKLKVGMIADGPLGAEPKRRRGGIDPDVAQIEAVRDAVGIEAHLRLDANGAWSVDRAEAVLRRVAPLAIELVEQPVAGLDHMAELNRRLRRRPPRGPGGEKPAPVAIAADESVSGPAEARAARDARACALATVKLSKVGQLRPDLDDALPFYLSSALDGPIGIAAAAHAYQALRPDQRAVERRGQPLAQGLATQRLFDARIAERECELRGPMLHLPPGPGLGVILDRDALEAHRI